MKKSNTVIADIIGRLVLALVLVAVAFGSTGCASFGFGNEPSIPAVAIEQPVLIVTQRHDAYVLADESLTPAERDLYLQTSEMLRALVDEARADADSGGG